MSAQVPTTHQFKGWPWSSGTSSGRHNVCRLDARRRPWCHESRELRSLICVAGRIARTNQNRDSDALKRLSNHTYRPVKTI